MEIIGIMSCISGLLKCSNGLARDRVIGEGYFGQCTEAFLGVNKA